MDDLLIRGGHVIDGTGTPGRDADVSIADGRIVAVERRSSRRAKRVIDARGQVVVPGLIDIHTHSDFTLPLNQRAESKIRQGVTLEVVGNCGFSRSRRRSAIAWRCCATTWRRVRPGFRSPRRRSASTSLPFR
jgi:N-acyl-D-amino-acid deacylase